MDAPIRHRKDSQQRVSRRQFFRFWGTLAVAFVLRPRASSPPVQQADILGFPLTHHPDTEYKVFLPVIRNYRAATLPLRQYADRIVGASGNRFKIGIYLEPGDINDPTGVPEQLASQQFNHRVNKGTQIAYNTGPSQWDFSQADNLLQKSSLANQSTLGELIWGWEETIPSWIRYGGYTRDQLIAIIQNHFTTILNRYRGRIGAYQVVNEAHNPGPGGNDWWEQHIGSDYVQIAFQIARQVDPSAVLIYNHYSNETLYGTNYGITKSDIDALKSQELVDAVGVQLHLWSGRPAKTDVIAAMQSYGLPVWVTEFDSNQLPWVGDPPREQAAITQSMMEAALSTVTKVLRHASR